MIIKSENLIRHAGEYDPQDVGNVARGQEVRSDQHPVNNYPHPTLEGDSGMRQNDDSKDYWDLIRASLIHKCVIIFSRISPPPNPRIWKRLLP